MSGGSNEQPILVYLVDDDEDHLKLNRKALSDQDPRLTFKGFTSPGKALEVLAADRPDVVVTDYLFNMEMDGIVFMEKSREAGYAGPFIFLAGQGSEAVAAEAFRRGADDYFSKEIGFAHFIKITQAVRRAVTNRREAIEKDNIAKEYRRVEDFCMHLMRKANDAIVILDDSGRILDANDKVFKDSGYAPGDLIGHQFTEFFPTEIRQGMWERFNRLMQGEPYDRLQVSTARKSGELREQDMCATLISTPSGGKQILVIGRDITDLKEKERSLILFQKLMEDVLDALEEVIHVVDRDLMVLHCNRNMDRLSRGKVTAADIIGRRLPDVFPFLEKSGALEEYRRVFETGVPLVTREVTFYEGEEIATRTLKMPVRDPAGRIEKVVTVIRDVSAERRLQKEREGLLRAVEESVVGIGVTGPDNRLIYVNRRHAEIYGYGSPEELVGSSWTVLASPDFMEGQGKEINEALVKTGHWIGESVGLRKDGTLFPILVSENMLRNEAGEFQGVVSIIQDITKEKMLNNELALKNQELRALSDEMNSFISMTSHELRGPLTNITGFTQLLEERIDKLSMPEIKEFVGRISGNASRLQFLIEDLLSFSRERRRQAEIVEIDVNSIIREVLNQLSRQVESSGANIEVKVSVPDVKADRQKLFQILKNLVENALTYRRDGVPPRITVSVSPAADGGAVFAVSDNGLGVQEAERDTIFEIFRRGSASRGRPGTGVGLALVKENLSKMDGTIRLESTPASGSTFSFTLLRR